MSLFECKPEQLAQLFAENPTLYKDFISVLNLCKGRRVLSNGLEEKLGDDFAFMQRAHNIAQQGRYYVFSTYDSWSERTGESSEEGVTVYQLISKKFVEKLGIGDHGPPNVEKAISYLKKQNVKEIYTLNLPRNSFYKNLRGLYIDGEGDEIERKELDSYCCGQFKRKGIKVVKLSYPQ